MKKILLALIVLLAFILRLYRIDAPLADWHSWRQADTSAVSRNFLKMGFDLLHPRFDDLSSSPSKMENPQGYRFVEFPIYNVIHAALAKTFPVFNLEVWGRLISIFASLGSLIFLYVIVEKYLGINIALLASFFFAVLPFNIYYSRTILPEAMMVMTSLGMIYFFDKWIKDSKLLYCYIAILLAATSFLLKPFTLVLLLPIAYLGWRKWQFNYLKWLILFLCFFVSLLPFLGWRWWMGHFPEGIPQSAWLFNEAGIRFKGAWFYWLFAERIGRLILGYWGLILFGLGLVAKPTKKEGLFFLSWLGAILVYFIIIAGGNVQHDYYQVLAIPIICVFLSKGSYFLLTAPKQYFNKIICHLSFVICLLFLFAFSWYHVRDFFNINNPVIVEAGKVVDKLVPKDAKIIAPYSGDTAFLYQTNRRGWPIGVEIGKMASLGAQYYVNINFGPETDWIEKNYCVIQKTPRWIIADLTRKCE
jgi:hypothetical protein